jgi:hypothetical protein
VSTKLIIMKKILVIQICCIVALLFSPFLGKTQVINGSEIFASSWFRNNNAGTGLYNQATGTGIYSPSTGMMTIYNNGSFTANEIFSNSWFRNNAAGTGLFNQATGTGIYSPSAGMMTIYNNGSLTSNEVYSNSWYRNNVAGTGLYNQATGTGIYSPSAGMMTIYNNGSFTANEIFSNSWFRNNAAGTGLYNQATGTGIYSPSAGMMAIYNNGNLMIGNTSTPAGYKLYVEQGILTEKVKVALKTTGDWSDYVFEPGYQLKPLHEVETFIKTNNHLPGVASAETLVKEGGIDVNKMFAAQMEKIEELTLYLIQANKRLEKLEKENEAQKAIIQQQKKQGGKL